MREVEFVDDGAIERSSFGRSGALDDPAVLANGAAIERSQSDASTAASLSAMARSCGRASGDAVLLGTVGSGWMWSRPQCAVLVIGPPRSGKTSAIVVPAVLSAGGAVVSTSTKTEVMAATAGSRREVGRCLLYDPTGSVPVPRGVEMLSWSPVRSAGSWDAALATARSMAATARPTSPGSDSYHWTERAESLLAPLLHAAAVAGLPMSRVVRWVNRRDAPEPLEILEEAAAESAADLLFGIASTDAREQSGIWSTASSILSPYRSEAALAMADGGGVPFDADGFASSADTIYVCAPGRQQALVSPLVVGLLEEIRSAVYRLHGEAMLSCPVLFALDEVANIAPIPDLPSLVSEGGGQGVTTLACIQDLSQARSRWGRPADGFFTLFGTKVLLGGIGDLQTVDTVSRLAGHLDVATRSVTAPQWWSALRQGSSVTWSVREKSVLPPDAVARGVPGTAIVIEGMNPAYRVALTPYFSCEPWKTICAGNLALPDPRHRHELSGEPDASRLRRPPPLASAVSQSERELRLRGAPRDGLGL